MPCGSAAMRCGGDAMRCGSDAVCRRRLGIEMPGEYIQCLMLAARLLDIEQRMLRACERSGRSRADVTLVAVTKTQPADRINEVLDAGLTDIGENRIQEYLEKHDQLRPHRFHMIGHLQRNKVKYVLGRAVLVHSVDSAALADEIERLAHRSGRACDVLIEVNSSGEESKFGVEPETAAALADHIMRLPHVNLRGLMTVAEYVEQPETLRPVFRMMRDLRDTLTRTYPGENVSELSMGMTNDFEIAIEEGATLVRIGSAIFGPRA
jgi:pyridoxal phosphate enzyme (YggS family)